MGVQVLIRQNSNLGPGEESMREWCWVWWRACWRCYLGSGLDTGPINAILVCSSLSLCLSLSLSLCSHAHALLRINDQCEVGTCTYAYLYIYNMRLVDPSLPLSLPHHTYMSRSISVLHSLAALVNDPQQILLFPPARGLCPLQVCTHQQIVVYTSINTLELVRMSIRQHNCMYTYDRKPVMCISKYVNVLAAARPSLRTHAQRCVALCVFGAVYIYICIHIHDNIFVYTYVYTYVYKYIYVFMYLIYVHIHICTYTYMYMWERISRTTSTTLPNRIRLGPKLPSRT